MSYAQIDPVISAWVEEHGLTLFTNTEGVKESNFRCVYISSEQGECCQIWIDQPNSGEVAVHAEDVESRLDEPMRQDWSVSIPQLKATLDCALAFTRNWFARS